MKKYVKPMMDGEVFVSNEYIAACYRIKCTTPNNNQNFKYLYEDTNKNGVYDEGADELIVYKESAFKGCNKWHNGVIRDEAPQVNAFVLRKDDKYPVKGPIGVFWWQEEGLGSDFDFHMMTMGTENYETNPNAS